PASRLAPAHGSVHNVRRGCLRVQNGSCVSLHVAALVSSESEDELHDVRDKQEYPRQGGVRHSLKTVVGEQPLPLRASLRNVRKEAEATHFGQRELRWRVNVPGPPLPRLSR